MSKRSTSASPKHAPALDESAHIYLIDGSAYIFRAYFAMFKASQARGASFTRSDGTPTGAVMTFCNMLWKLLREGLDDGKPTHVGVVFDHSGESFRNEIYDAYKANRDEPPEELVPQFPLIREAVRAFGLTPIEQEGYEADDLIATYVAQAKGTGAEITIVSGDKDLMQLVGDDVSMYDPMPGNERRIGRDEVVKKFGVGPDKVVEVQALAGDSTDNIPGIPGIGVKTAAQLIEQFGDVETLLERAGEIKQNKRRENVIQYAEQARISRKLVELDSEVPLEHPLEELGSPEVDGKKLIAFCKAMEFTTLTKRVADAYGLDMDKVAADESLAPDGEPAEDADDDETTDGAPGPAHLATHRAKAIRDIPIDRDAYETVTTLERLNEWLARAREQGYFAFDIETTSLSAMRAEVVGVSMALKPGEACYVPMAHRKADELDFGDANGLAQVPRDAALEALKPVLEDDGILKIGQNLKYDYLVLLGLGIEMRAIDDTMLISYALDTGRGTHGMDELARRHLGHTCITYKEVAGTGKAQVTFDLVPIDKATAYAAEDADVTLRLWLMLKPRLAAEGMTAVYETLERPMVPVLARMEHYGIKVDRDALSRLSGDFAQKLGALESEIYELAGEEFNIGSTKQLADLLFGKLGYPGGRKTKTGAWSTGARVLEDLVADESLTEAQRQLPIKLLEWRQLSKLKNTYTDTLPDYIHPDTGRIHTSYSLGSVRTGRLASTEPNLQNIPIRTREGRQIRTAFVAQDGHKLISADYSQIELRVLAHIADIQALKRAFAEGLDIHAMTASEMFGFPIEKMPPEIRSRAKAINFGIIYGISAFGLAQQLGIPRSEAGEYIKKYFERFPGIRDYMEEMKAEAHDKGYVRTIFGRKIHFPELETATQAARGNFERAAINAPIQGSAADILRRAMIRMPDALAEAGLSARMLLQVHDELIIEAREDEVEPTIDTAVQIMSAANEPAVDVSVPLKVDARAADNWDDAH
ncbi:DNA polymerase I [Dichotomicrobium thermohalophilum]|uniref:DNA polymerase I n=1 Tax=Dichotomicrobium thermohalophilum TaxID=933063 RepID=A0A397Q2H5_9HYPH|nr:DNA polymerase I [Dichotomicrobium thermohalophilum]RIA55566.1 DNA polymerase I [Dichotomicrobium thermohalophilum]